MDRNEERKIHEQKKEEHRAKNLFFDQVYRLMIFLGLLLLMTFLLQIYALKTEGKMILRTYNKALEYGEPMISESGKEFYQTNYVPYTKDQQADYYMHYISWRHPFRKIAGSLFTKFYRSTGWVPEIVNDIALRWLWILILAVIWFTLKAILSIRLSILIAKQGRGENDGLRVRNFKPLYHDRFKKYIVVMAFAIAGPVKHAIFWPVLGAIYVVVAELWYMLYLVMATNPTNPHFAKKHWWVRMAIRLSSFGLRNWRESNNRIKYNTGKVLTIIAVVLTTPFSRIWKKIKNICVAAALEYDREHGYEGLGDDEDEDE